MIENTTVDMGPEDDLFGATSHNVSNASYPTETSSDGGQSFDPSRIADRIFRMLKNHVGTSDDNLRILALWIMHARVYREMYTTPRLLITSIIPGAGKTTLLEWIAHLCAKSEMLSAISSASLLANLADQGYVLLVDEADRSLRKDNPLTADFIAVVNTGYKRGGSRTVQEPDKNHGWKVVRKSTYAPVAFAGNNPDLSADTKQRCIQVFLYPNDEVEETDWEIIENDQEFLDLKRDLDNWAAIAKESIKPRPILPDIVKGRYKEVWLPLARIAQTQSGEWLDVVRRLSAEYVEQAKMDADMGLANDSPHILLLKDIARLWASQWASMPFVGSQQMCDALAASNPKQWGSEQVGSFGRLTTKRLASMLKKAGVEASRNRGHTKRGYRFSAFSQAWKALRIWETLKLGPPRPNALDVVDMSNTFREGVNKSQQPELPDVLAGKDASDTLYESKGSNADRPSDVFESSADATPDLEQWAASLITTADVKNWAALSIAQLFAIRKVKNTGLWLNKTSDELTKRGVNL
ncbi:DUF3631 domain-containing protein [Bifidobacterium sp. SO4]|uniref:DUF3631 domain-containing protein n=1 Tax=Bifidobacterium sp. SO4 TaxID=2809030 RepID=UPI001BDCCABB|nr:DUF3631 domain-containing protein [Bifidobacterium sp. SO4]MBT1171421.1 DUF3631 domain-containing protein [Bifidobacterium sp. SO4]